MKRLLFFILVGLLFVSCHEAGVENQSQMDTTKTTSPTVGKGQKTVVNTIKPYRVCFYVENSISMRGYVYPNSIEFSDILRSVNASCGMSDFFGTREYFYIANKITSIDDFSQFLEEIDKDRGGMNRNESHLSDMFNLIIDNMDDTTLSIFVSDCIFSPGKVNAEVYIHDEKCKIMETINEKIKENSDFVAWVNCFESDFNGPYHNNEDEHIVISKSDSIRRPFYVWVMGSKDMIMKYRQAIARGDIKNKIKGEYLFCKPEKDNLSSTVVSSSKGKIMGGNYNTYVKKAKLDGGKYRVSVGVDMSKYECLGDGYLKNKLNYKVKPSYYKIVKIENMKVNKITHKITLETTQKISPTTVQVKLQNPMPQWVKAYNIDPKDIDTIFTDYGKVRTYGIESLMLGFYEGFNMKNNSLGTIKINININQ